jgi:hypothetical protein
MIIASSTYPQDASKRLRRTAPARCDEIVVEDLQSWNERVWIRHARWLMMLGMATLQQKRECELHVREWLERYGLPTPDWFEYGQTCIRAFFAEQKLCLRVDIDEDPDHDYSAPIFGLTEHDDDEAA